MGRAAIMVAFLLAVLLPSGAAGATTRPLAVPVLTSSRTVHRLVALSFDDGPSPYTASILAILERYRVPATFFVVGARVADFPSVVRAEARAGDDIGNHTYTHANLTWLADRGVDEQLRATQDAVWRAAHVRPIWFRPPYGAVDQRVADDAWRLGLHTVKWSVDPRDWSEPGTQAIVARVLAGVRPGSIVILHDGGGYRGETVAALPVIIRSLRRRGYRFISLDTMFYPRLPLPPVP